MKNCAYVGDYYKYIFLKFHFALNQVFHNDLTTFVFIYATIINMYFALCV